MILFNKLFDTGLGYHVIEVLYSCSHRRFIVGR